MIETLVFLVVVLVIVGLVLSIVPRLGFDPPIANAVYILIVVIAILVLLGMLPQVGWWHR